MSYRLNPSFKTYEEAKIFYKVQPINDVLRVSQVPGSYDRVTNGGNVVYYSGFGRKSKLGHPSGNQQYETQLPFLKNVHVLRSYPIFQQFKDKTVEYLGFYKFLGITKKMTFEGFVYFEIKLMRVGK
jgi:hypothetical protein